MSFVGRTVSVGQFWTCVNHTTETIHHLLHHHIKHGYLFKVKISITAITATATTAVICY